MALPDFSPDIDLALNDLGPLAWVLDELRKAVGSATRALRRFVMEAEALPASERGQADATHLRLARQQLHQAAGAMDMVGQGAAANMLRAMEAAVQRCTQQPEQCNADVVARLERASFGLLQYLDSVLRGGAGSAVALFPQYRDVLALAGQSQAHPVDLWSVEGPWRDPELTQQPEPLAYDAQVRARFEQSVLKLVKSSDLDAALRLRDICAGFAAAQTARQPRVFWKVAAGFFEALGAGLLPFDVYVKRAVSRVLQQHTALLRSPAEVPDRLIQELAFFCAQAQPRPTLAVPLLQAVRRGLGLVNWKPVDYEHSPFGRFDPALLAQAHKRIGAAKEAWSSVAGGDLSRMRGLVDQFSMVADSLVKLYPQSQGLAMGLVQAAESTARSGVVPSTALSMEVATSIMYLDAAFEELDPSDADLAKRTARLAHRLTRVQAGGSAEPLEPWIEDLYRRVSDRQTMGSVVGELRSALGELERAMDPYFRNPKDPSVLRGVPGQLSQMRGVLSVLGLDHAVRAVASMRETVERMMQGGEQERRSGTFDRLGNNLGALGLLFDMLSYQPNLAKRLFVFDEARRELQPLMGRETAAETQASALPPDSEFPLQSKDLLSPQQFQPTSFDLPATSPAELRPDFSPTTTSLFDGPATVLPTQTADLTEPATLHDAFPELHSPTSLAAPGIALPPPEMDNGGADLEEDDLLGIFLEEAREVVQSGTQAVAELANSPDSVDHQTVLRRAFHTLKGSSRMVGLTEFGEAAWSMEQVLNSWLADRRPASVELRHLSQQALQCFGQWAQDIANGQAEAWRAQMFQSAADALRLHNRLENIEAPARPPMPASEAAVADLPTIAFPDAVPDTVQDAGSPLPLALEASREAASDPRVPQPLDDIATLQQTLGLGSDELSMEEIALEFPQDDAAVPTQQDTLEIADIDLAGLKDYVDSASQTLLDRPTTVPEPTEATDDMAQWAFDLPELEPESAAAADQVAEQAPQTVASDAEILAAFEAEIGAGETLPQTPAEPEAPSPASSVTEPLPVEVAQPVPELAPEPFTAQPPTPAELPVEALEPVLQPELLPTVAEPDLDDQTRRIGSLRINIPLYNVYLNEADEWSRRLQTELGEWALELDHRPLADTTVALAHSLAGSSATVGFMDLSGLARELEHAMEWTHLQAQGTAEEGRVYGMVAEEIRRLLHQFAAGFLKEPNAAVLEALRQLHAEKPQSVTEPVEEALPTPAPAAEVPPLTTPEQPVLSPVADAAPEAEPRHGDEEVFESVDNLDTDLFHIFEDEAAELLPMLSGALRQWTARPDNLSARAEVLRVLHTLKGSARLAGAMRLGERAHRMETAIERLDPQAAEPQGMDELLAELDALQQHFDQLRAPATPVAATPETESVAAGAAGSTGPLVAGAATAPAQSAAPGQQVRIRAQLLDRMVNQTGEVMMTRSRIEAGMGQMRSSLEDLTGNLERLRDQLRDIELQAELQMQSRLAHTREAERSFDPLEFDRFTRVQELTRMMAESVNDVATVQRNLERTLDGAEADLAAQSRQTRELQRDLLRTRMVEFETIAERLYRVVRQAAKESGKQVKLDISGGAIEMDRGVLERMTPAFEHLLRNAVAHGIESPEQREASGKAAVGALSIQLSHEGNDVAIRFSDDGAGLDRARIRDKALAMGLVKPEQALAPNDLMNLVFMPGFSTAAQVTELSGRGIGMDVVRSEVNALGGRIESGSEDGRGTHFDLILPLTTAVTQVVMVRIGALSFGIPANLVELVRRTPVEDLPSAYAQGRFTYNGEDLPFFWAGALLQLGGPAEASQGKTASLLVLRSAQQRLALHVDEVLGNQEVVVKNLGPQLSRLPGLSGMTVLPSGAVVLIYNPVALAAVYGESARQRQQAQRTPRASDAAATAPTASQVPLVLVVDDSITVRRVTQRLLQREGYRVVLAVDGVQALERLRTERPALVLTDIEMPRMDGFELTRSIRASSAWRSLPLVVISSRMAEKHRQMAKELGVDHYLGKPYGEEELLSLIRRYAKPQLSAPEQVAAPLPS